MSKQLKSGWSINLESATATHRDGWVFKFSPVEDEFGAFDGECIAQPSPLTTKNIDQASRLAREAGDVYIEALEARH